MKTKYATINNHTAHLYSLFRLQERLTEVFSLNVRQWIYNGPKQKESLMDIDKIIFSFLEASIPCEGIKDCRIVDVICCVMCKETSIGQHISKLQTIWQLLAGEEKSIPTFKINLLWDMADSIPYLDIWFLIYFRNRILPPPPNTSKNTGSAE
jgi:hypothetical protein